MRRSNDFDAIGIKRGGSPGDSGVTGVMRCGSVWACPVCSAKIRQERALELEAGLVRHLAAGGGTYMLTLTLRHGMGDSLRRSMDVLLGSWRKVQQTRAWREHSREMGMIGWVRSTEITFGLNGWHPHLHLLVLTDKPLSEHDRIRWEQATAESWQAVVGRSGLGAPDLVLGCRLQACTTPHQGAEYVLKEQVGRGGTSRPVMELLRGDLKSGRRKGLVPWDLLAGAATGEKHALVLWWEYESVTRGRRCMGWSRGLRDRLALGQEQDDQELVEQDEGGEVVAWIERDVWRCICRRRLDDELLAVSEHGGFDGISRWMAARGWPPPRPA